MMTGSILTRGAIGAGAIVGALALWSGLAARANEALVPADGDFVDVPGARLHYTDSGGPGPVLVMIHGLMGQLRNFSYSLTERLTDSYRVILVDRPGWGYSEATGDAQPGIEEQADIMAAFIDTLGLKQPTIVGHSLGGAVALALAIRHPGKANNLVLLAPLTQPQDVPPPAFRGLMTPAPLRGILSWTLAIPMTTLTGPGVLKAVFTPDAVPLDFPIRGGGALSARPVSYRSGAFELGDASDSMRSLVPHYGAIDVPVSILFGRQDNLLDPEQHGTTTADLVARGEITLIEGGHMLPVTHPDETALFIRANAARMV